MSTEQRNPDQGKIVIDKNSLVPISISISIAIVLAGAAWQVATSLSSLDSKLARIEYRLDSQWSYQDQLYWASQLSEMNRESNIRIPPVTRSGPNQ